MSSNCDKENITIFDRQIFKKGIWRSHSSNFLWMQVNKEISSQPLHHQHRQWQTTFHQRLRLQVSKQRVWFDWLKSRGYEQHHLSKKKKKNSFTVARYLRHIQRATGALQECMTLRAGFPNHDTSEGPFRQQARYLPFHATSLQKFQSICGTSWGCGPQIHQAEG